MGAERGPRFCEACHQTNEVEHHHVVPISAGGADMPMNMVALCSRCHTEIHSMMKGGEAGPGSREEVVAILRGRGTQLHRGNLPVAWCRVDTLLDELDCEDARVRTKIRDAFRDFVRARGQRLSGLFHQAKMTTRGVFNEFLAQYSNGYDPGGGEDEAQNDA